MKLKIAVSALLIVALIAAGCAAAVSHEEYDALLTKDAELQAEIDALETANSQLQAEIDALTTANAELQEEIDALAILRLIDLEIAALNELDFETVYNQKTPGYRSRVTLEEYQTFMETAYAQFIPLVGIMKVSVIDLDIRVEGEWAYMTGKLALNGTVLLEYTDEFPDIWHKIDGTWYDVEENPLDPGYDPSELPQ